MTIFIVSGIVYAIVGGLAASLLRNPPAGYTRRRRDRRGARLGRGLVSRRPKCCARRSSICSG